jgi:hypothetical protein
MRVGAIAVRNAKPCSDKLPQSEFSKGFEAGRRLCPLIEAALASLDRIGAEAAGIKMLDTGTRRIASSRAFSGRSCHQSFANTPRVELSIFEDTDVEVHTWGCTSWVCRASYRGSHGRRDRAGRAQDSFQRRSICAPRMLAGTVTPQRAPT